jgi:CBF1 interacting corepressor
VDRVKRAGRASEILPSFAARLTRHPPRRDASPLPFPATQAHAGEPDARAGAARATSGSGAGGSGWSHQYLHLKSWHPLSYKNREKVFQAEQAAAARARRDADAAREFAENAEFFKNTEALAAKDRASARYKRELAFMYQKPPGFDAALEKERTEKAEAAARDAEKARAAEETAARLAAGLPPLSEEEILRRKKRKMRKDADGRNVAAADAFPELAGAPRLAPRGGGDADGVGARPLGVQIRATQCLRCGGFGHASGDRECPMRAHNPNDAFRAKIEDPLALMRAREALASSKKFQLTRGAHASGRSPTRGGVDPSAANQQLLLGDDAYGDDAFASVGNADAGDGGTRTTAGRPFAGGEAGDDGAGKGGILASLPREERRRLIREFKAKEKEARRAEVAAAEAFLRGRGVASAETRGDRKAKREKREKKDKEKRRRRD